MKSSKHIVAAVAAVLVATLFVVPTTSQGATIADKKEQVRDLRGRLDKLQGAADYIMVQSIRSRVPRAACRLGGLESGATGHGAAGGSLGRAADRHLR